MIATQFLAFAVVFVLAFAFRFITVAGLSGDDHVVLWIATAVLQGDLPYRDFFEPGAPLHWMLSAAAQSLVGYRVLGEVLLGVTLEAFAAALGFHLAWQASRSRLLAALVICLALPLLAAAKLYSYPKVVILTAAIWLCWRYIDRPSRGRAAALALGTLAAFLLRHDYGLYVGAGATMSVVAAHVIGGPRAVLSGLLRYGALGVLLVTPFLIVVQATEGLSDYVSQRLELARRIVLRVPVAFQVDDAPLLAIGIGPPAPTTVRIHWRPDVTANDRRALEQQYHLENRSAPAGRWWRYELLDYSEANVTALATEAQVEALDGVEVADTTTQYIVPAQRRQPEVAVSWSQSLTREQREELEQRFRLTNSRPAPYFGDGSDRRWLYAILAAPNADVTALVTHPGVEEVDGVAARRVPRSYEVKALRPTGAPVEQPPPDGVPIAVRWTEDISAERRAALEQQYRLTDGTEDPRDPTPSWQYTLTDTSKGNIGALLADSRVVRADGLDTETHHPVAETWLSAVQRELGLPGLMVRSSIFHAANAGPWLYYLFVSLPWAVLLWLGIDTCRRRQSARGMPHEVPKMLVAAVLLAAVEWILMRQLGYLNDLAVYAAIVGAWLLARAAGPLRTPIPLPTAAGPPAPRPLTRRLVPLVATFSTVVALALLAVTITSVVAYVNLPARMLETGLSDGLGAAWARARKSFENYAVSPPVDSYVPVGTKGDRAIHRYVYECTQPGDRIWEGRGTFPLPYYAERRSVQHPYWYHGFRQSPQHQQQVLAWLQSQSVPLIIDVGSLRPLSFLDGYDLIREYVSQTYVDVSSAKLSQNREAPTGRQWVFADRRRAPSGVYEPLDLPCFR